MAANPELQPSYKKIKNAVTIAIIIGMILLVFFIVTQKDSSSAIYLVPDSVFYYSDDNSVEYSYGVISSELQRTDYTLDTYIGDTLVNTRHFTLDSGETIRERGWTILPDDGIYPKKVSLALTAGSRSESVHFWVTNTTK